VKDDLGCRMNSMMTFSRPGWVSCSKAFVSFLLLLSLATALACSGGLPKDIPTNKEAVKKALKDKSVEKLKEVAEGVPAVQKATDRVMQAQLEGCAKVFQTGLQVVAHAFSVDQKDVQLDAEMRATRKFRRAYPTRHSTFPCPDGQTGHQTGSGTAARRTPWSERRPSPSILATARVVLS